MDNIVLDTNVLVMSISAKNKYRNIWRSFVEEHFTLCVTNDIANEFQDGAKMLAEIYNGVCFGDQMISVYALDPDADNYCKNLIDEKTHLIGINGLDAVSEVIGEEYDRLYRLYLKLKRGK